MSRAERLRGTDTYTKPPMTAEQLIQLLKSKGLRVNDEEGAERYLQAIGYYRFSPYMIPYRLGSTSSDFREGAQFDDVRALNAFDRNLRLLVLDALEQVEVAVRAAVTDSMSIKHNDSHWYVYDHHFKDARTHARLISSVEKICQNQLSRLPEVRVDTLTYPSALEHYLSHYGEPHLPPAWTVMELLTIGQLHSVYRNLRNRSEQTSIARQFGRTAPVLESWLASYVRVRNICAHHGRLWNVGLGVYPKIPVSPSIAWLGSPLPESSRVRLYPVLVSLQVMLISLTAENTWAQRLYNLLSDQPPLVLQGMGVPIDWHPEPFWGNFANS